MRCVDSESCRGLAMKEFLEYIVKNLVNHPDEVCVTEIIGTHSMILELRVNQSDIGAVIGRGGRTINAMRALIAATIRNKENVLRVTIEIVEEKEKRPASSQTV